MKEPDHEVEVHGQALVLTGRAGSRVHSRHRDSTFRLDGTEAL